MDARTDQEKYVFGCRTMENFMPLIYGGAERRPGLEYIAGCKSNSAASRLVAFEHSVDDTYILEFANQVIRVYRDGGQVVHDIGDEDISALDNVVAHWKLNDDLATTAVVDADGATHNGVATANTNTLHTIGKAGTGCFDLYGTSAVEIADSGDFTFIEGTNGDFSIMAWIYVTNNTDHQMILSKWDTSAKREWAFSLLPARTIKLDIYDQSASAGASRVSDDALTLGWHHVVVTYEGEHGSWAGATAANHILFYVDGVVVDSTATNNAAYVKMENLSSGVAIGAYYLAGTLSRLWLDRIDDVSIFNDVLSATEIATYYADVTSTAYEIESPYLTADLFGLKFAHSADVIFITHSDYEPRKLSRIGHSTWTLEAMDFRTGPWRDENDNILKTITPSAATGSITLTATNHTPFAMSTTAGHSPSGTEATSKSQTGALFKIVYPLDTLQYQVSLEDNYTDDQTEGVSWKDCGTVYKGDTWYLETQGTWTGTLNVQRNYTLGAAHDAAGWEDAMPPFGSKDDRNVDTSGTETINDASYRVILTTSGDAAEALKVYFWTNATDHIGIVEITAVASGTSATGTVLKTLGSTSATHKWSEGAWSNYRGWPIAVEISPEERLTFGGSAAEPLNIWGTKIGDFSDMAIGTLDDSAINFTLVGSGKQNRIRWLVPKAATMIGTVGGEHLLGASEEKEALTPDNVQAKPQTSHGSEDIQALLVNQSILFVQRGGRKIRELLYDFDSDSHKADDLTVFANHITESGIVDMDYQRAPDPVLWCVRDDGEIAVMNYERDQKVFAWSRLVTTDSTSDSDFESVAIIYGGAGEEDEVWVTVKRTINSSTVRYIERFKPRDWGSDDEDAFFVDSGLTYDGVATTTITGLGHLVGESVAIYADGEKQDNKTVPANGKIAIASASKAQIGLAYTSTLKPMKLDLHELGRATTKKVTRGIISLYKTMRGEWGSDSSALDPIVYRRAGVTTTEFPVFTGDLEMPFRAGYERSGDVIVQQSDPLPMTVLALTLDIGASRD